MTLKRILAVDDEEVVRDFVSRALRHAGYEVVTAPSGKEALDFLAGKRQHFDLVIVDLSMPQMDGRTLVRKIREHPALASVPVLFLSGLLTKEVEDGFPTLAKPVELKVLLDNVRHLTATPGAT